MEINSKYSKVWAKISKSRRQYRRRSDSHVTIIIKIGQLPGSCASSLTYSYYGNMGASIQPSSDLNFQNIGKHEC